MHHKLHPIVIVARNYTEKASIRWRHAEEQMLAALRHSQRFDVRVLRAVQQFFIHHSKGVVKHPHHYVTATILSWITWMVGHFSMEIAIVAFAYAIAESFTIGE